jgi:hypothetical protein
VSELLGSGAGTIFSGVMTAGAGRSCSASGAGASTRGKFLPSFCLIFMNKYMLLIFSAAPSLQRLSVGVLEIGACSGWRCPWVGAVGVEAFLGRGAPMIGSRTGSGRARDRGSHVHGIGVCSGLGPAQAGACWGSGPAQVNACCWRRGRVGAGQQGGGKDEGQHAGEEGDGELQ